MTKNCSSCGRTVDDNDGMELTDGRFFCQSGGCQTKFLNGVFEEKVLPNLLRQNEQILARTESGVCDICNGKITAPDGYLLTTRQVVSTPAYWQHYYRYHQSEFIGLGVHSYADFCSHPLVRPMVIQTLAGQRTPWMVCGNCISMFAVNHNLMHEYAEKWWGDKSFLPPGSGPASPFYVKMQDSAAVSAASEKLKSQANGTPTWSEFLKGLRSPIPGSADPPPSAPAKPLDFLEPKKKKWQFWKK